MNLTCLLVVGFNRFDPSWPEPEPEPDYTKPEPSNFVLGSWVMFTFCIWRNKLGLSSLFCIFWHSGKSMKSNPLKWWQWNRTQSIIALWTPDKTFILQALSRIVLGVVGLVCGHFVMQNSELFVSGLGLHYSKYFAESSWWKLTSQLMANYNLFIRDHHWFWKLQYLSLCLFHRPSRKAYNILLDAFAISGMVEQARTVFKSMRRDRWSFHYLHCGHSLFSNPCCYIHFNK